MARMLIKARCGPLRLRHDGTTYRMDGGKYGSHTLRERVFNERVGIHWFGYCRNNGYKPNAADNWPA